MFPFQNQGNVPNFGNKPPQTLESKVESLEKEVSSLKELNLKMINDLNSIMGWCSQLFATHQQQKQQIEYLTQVVSYLHQQSVKNTPNTAASSIPDLNQQPHNEINQTTTVQPVSSYQKQPNIAPLNQNATEYTPKQKGGEDKGYRQKERYQDNREHIDNRDRNSERNTNERHPDVKGQDRNRKSGPPPRGNPPILTNLATNTDQPCRGWFSPSDLTSETNTTLPPNPSAVITVPAPSPAPSNFQPSPSPSPAPSKSQPAPSASVPTDPAPSPAPSPHTSLRSQVTGVLELFPNAPIHIVEKDLRQTKSVDATVARILDGSLTWQGKQF